MENKKCSICNKEVYSELGKSCMLCGMALEDESKEFCSKICRRKYNKFMKIKLPLAKIMKENKNPGGCCSGYLPSHVEREIYKIRKL